jgi:uncharacterized protein with von Willebrand factor type A (vWA) domain
MAGSNCSFHHSVGPVSERMISRFEEWSFYFFFRAKQHPQVLNNNFFKRQITFGTTQKLIHFLDSPNTSESLDELLYKAHFSKLQDVLSVLLSHTQDNQDLAHRFAHELGEWVQSTEMKLEEYLDLQAELRKIKNLIRAFQQSTLGSLDLEIIKQFNVIQYEKLELIYNSLLLWNHKSEDVIQKTIREERSSFIKRLLEMAINAKKGEEVLQDVFGTTAGLWDLIDKEGFFQSMAEIKLLADELEQESSLQRLAEIIGRQEYKETPSPQSNSYVKNLWEEFLGRSEIDGITYSGNLNAVLPQELSYFNEEGLDNLFTHDLVNEQLLTSNFITSHINEEDDTQQPKLLRQMEAQRGPVILVVDTSGSMEGPAETCAKAFSLALARVCFSEHRPLHIILFSTKTVNFRLEPQLQNFDQYSNFLGFSFRGGTDLRPAVKEAIAISRQKDFSNADVIIVSDFRIPKIFLKYSSKIYQNQRNHGMRIYAMTIGSDPIQDPTNLFDDHWHYAIDAGGNPQGIIRLKDIPSSRRVHDL